jgi:glycine cleavage system H protein
MSLVLALLTLGVFILLELVKRSRNKNAVSDHSIALQPSAPKPIERFYHPGHSWAAVVSDDEVMVGADDFAQRALGRLSGIELPQLWTKVQQGQVYATLIRGEKSLPQAAPVSGTIVRINRKLEETPELINASPLDEGWIVKIAPLKLSLEVRNLLRGLVAERWEEAVRNHLVHWFSTPAHPVMQDGGKIVEGVSDLLTHDEWQRFTEEFFSVGMINRNNNLSKN